MARPKKAVTESATVETQDIVPVDPLELRVMKNVAGVLETNIGQLEAYVNAKLEEYKPELYMGDADMAKKDRAELNNAKKTLSQARINLMRELMKPYADFETRCKALERSIDTASGQLDVIVKEKEEKEKALKRMRVQELWLSKDFSLFPLEKIFSPKWLNKTAKEADILAEMDAAIAKTYKDLKTIEQVAEVCDAETVKAFYLDSLDIGAALDYGETLVRNREIARKEAAEREAREHAAQIARQEQEQRREMERMAKDAPVMSMAADALELTEEQRKPAVKDWVVSMQATDAQLNQLKAAMNALGIVYDVKELSF